MDQRVLSIVSVLQEEISLPASPNRLAELVNLSPSRLRHLFKVNMGVTIQCYQRHLRMDKARVLLETTFLSIKQIRAIVGINNDSHFTKDFKTAYGSTPTTYRVHVKVSAEVDKE
jgi:AraC family transcriptional regulator of arabinose operon